MRICAFYGKGRENGCFITTDYRESKESRKIALIVCAVVVLAVWLVLTIRINTIFPSKRLKNAGMGNGLIIHLT